MATLLFQGIGQAIGGGLGGALGGILGRAAGGFLGNAIDTALFSSSQKRVGPRLSEMQITGASEGTPITKIFGKARIPGHLIWAGPLEEETSTQTSRVGGKSLFGGPKVSTTTYQYFISFAIALSEGPCGSALGKIFADGQELDLSSVIYRYYPGDETQMPDSLIIAQEGEANAPAFRGIAYIVFEHFALAPFGNRLPFFQFEITRPLSDLYQMVSSVNLIPGATEFGYDPDPVLRLVAPGITQSENQHASALSSDFTVALEQLLTQCPTLEHISLVCAWFGTDLRCARCQIKPGVELREKNTTPHIWRAGGLERFQAHLISRGENGGSAYGGTPNDGSILRALALLHQKGIAVTFYPFLLMDIPKDTTQDDPYGGTKQPPYPWRGRITLEKAPTTLGTSDKTPGATLEVKAFFGTAKPSDFRQDQNKKTVFYDGQPEWSYRRMILHYAHLCAMAGGVEAFLIGSELKGVTSIRSAQHVYPAVLELIHLAEDVKSILPNTKISYAADWSEYHSHHPQDGSRDMCFHLDPLWASSAIDFIGVDVYFPLSDWRDTPFHLDQTYGACTDQKYLESSIEGGEYFDWYYLNENDRALQKRTPITDGVYQKPWVYRSKDFKGFWKNLHYNRSGGQEENTPTAWIPQTKPFWFTEVGCPAVDKGSNQPNTFFDPKSTESALPHFSLGTRDDLIQYRFLKAIHTYWGNDTHNPKGANGQSMICTQRLSIWAYDVRPFPAFPAHDEVWADAPNYPLGHWINGRASAVPLSDLLNAICALYGISCASTTGVNGFVEGFIIDQFTSARSLLEPLSLLFSFSCRDTPQGLVFETTPKVAARAYTLSSCVATNEDTPLWTITRKDRLDLPESVRITVADPFQDFRAVTVHAQKEQAFLENDLVLETNCLLSQAQAQNCAEQILRDLWQGDTAFSCYLPLSEIALEVGDVLRFQTSSSDKFFKVEELTDTIPREMRAKSLNISSSLPVFSPNQNLLNSPLPQIYGPPLGLLLDLPMLNGQDTPLSPIPAFSANPWPKAIALYRAPSPDVPPTWIGQCTTQATLGTLETPLKKGPLWRADDGNSFKVKLLSGALSSVSQSEWLQGKNKACIGTEETGFEIIFFKTATLVGPSSYEITGLLRGQFGSGPEMTEERQPNTWFILLNEATTPLPSSFPLGKKWFYAVGPAHLNFNHPAYQHTESVFQGLSARPYPPVHGNIKPQTNGEWLVSWIRQSRWTEDTFDAFEVPLYENHERYLVEFLIENTTVKTFETAQPEFVFSQLDQSNFLGEKPLFVKISQLSDIFGPGSPLVLGPL